MSAADRVLLWFMRRRGLVPQDTLPTDKQSEFERVRHMTDDVAATMAMLDDVVRNELRKDEGQHGNG